MGNNIVDSYANLNAATGPDSCYGPVRKMGNLLLLRARTAIGIIALAAALVATSCSSEFNESLGRLRGYRAPVEVADTGQGEHQVVYVPDVGTDQPESIADLRFAEGLPLAKDLAAVSGERFIDSTTPAEPSNPKFIPPEEATIASHVVV